MGVIADRLAVLGEPRPRWVGQALQRMVVANGRRGCFHAVESKGGIFIQTLQSIDSGGGREALLALCRLADELGCHIRLHPKPYKTTLRRTPHTTEQLIEYYKGYGFLPDGVYLKRLPLTDAQGR